MKSSLIPEILKKFFSGPTSVEAHQMSEDTTAVNSMIRKDFTTLEIHPDDYFLSYQSGQFLVVSLLMLCKVMSWECAQISTSQYVAR